jgi:hypothetical protein
MSREERRRGADAPHFSTTTTATTYDHKEVNMKTQSTRQHTNAVAVQPLTTFHKEDRMKNADQIRFASTPHMHRFGTVVAIALSILLLGFICSAQDKPIQPLGATNTYIPYFVTGTGYTDSIMWQPSTSQINDNGDFNLTNFASAYRIGGKVVLSASDYPNGNRSLAVGIATSSAGNSNTVIGDDAGNLSNANSIANTLVGSSAGYKNVSGGYNTCVGTGACAYANASGNTMLGVFAGFFTTGSFNTFLGQNAGNNNTTGDSNIYIGNAGPTTQENNTIRIGTNGSGIGSSKQNRVFIEPLENAVAQPCLVTINNVTGQLGGCTTSSRRFKEQIADMGDTSSKLLQLRPVTFFYKPEYDGTDHQLQYGLIAEEVAKVFPEMVVNDKDGKPYTVSYQLLAPMLLNELQKQHKVIATQQSELQTQLQQISAQRQEIDGLKLQLQQRNASLQERLSKLESYVATQMKVASENPPPTTPVASGGMQ